MIPAPFRLLLVPGLAIALLTGCESGPERVVVSNGYDDSDFYYSSGSPYSRSYGVLVVRNGGYYYSRGGHYYPYERHHHGGSYAGSSYSGGYHRDRDVRHVENVRNVENVRTTNVTAYNGRSVRDGGRTTQVPPSHRHGPPTAQTQVRTSPGGRTVVAAPGTRTVTTAPGQRPVVKHKGHDHDHDRD